MSLEEIIGECPHISLCTSSSGVREVDKDIGKGNLFIFAFKQLRHLQVEREENIDRPIRDKIELKIFGAGWPNQKYHNDEPFSFGRKLWVWECMVEVDGVEVLGMKDDWCFHKYIEFGQWLYPEWGTNQYQR